MVDDFRGSLDINEEIWAAGWHARYTAIAAFVGITLLGYGIDLPWVMGALGFFAAPVVAVGTMAYVNGNYEEVLQKFTQRANESAENILELEDDDISMYQLRSSSGSKAFRNPDKQYQIHTMLVTDVSVIIHDGNTLDMPSLSAEITDSTEEIYYDQLASVNYTDGEFWINRSDGFGTSWESDREPDDALADIQQRVRNYKRTEKQIT